MPQLHAKSTKQNYTGAARRVETYAKAHNLDPWEQETWTSWIQSTTARPQGQLSYTKIASAIISLRSRPPLKMLGTHLRASGAEVPIHQAPPISRDHLSHPALLPYRLPVLLAWKTASRWDEITKLQRSALEVIPPSDSHPLQILVDWERNTKASRQDPHRASRWTIMEGSLVDEIAALLNKLQPTEAITHCTTKQIEAVLKKMPGQYSAHSFKAGAIDFATAALQKIPSLSLLEREARLCRLAKHKHPLDPPSTTLRYLRTHLEAARLLGSHESTRLL